MHVLYLMFLCSPYAAPVFYCAIDNNNNNNNNNNNIAQGAKVLDKGG